MEQLKDKSIKYIYDLLLYTYYDYYYSVYYDFIIEAINKTLQDFKHKENYNITDIHNNIKENYI